MIEKDTLSDEDSISISLTEEEEKAEKAEQKYANRSTFSKKATKRNFEQEEEETRFSMHRLAETLAGNFMLQE